MPAPSHVLLLRHAHTAWNNENRRQGWADEPLTAAGASAAHDWARACGDRFDVIFTSDLQRARDTAQIIASGLGIEAVAVLDGLREQDQGAWTGLTKHQIEDRWPEHRPRRPVDGETPEAVRDRVLAALGAILRASGGGLILVVTHTGVIRAVERLAGVESPPVPHLQGRWFRLSEGDDQARPVIAAGLGTTGRPNQDRFASRSSAER